MYILLIIVRNHENNGCDDNHPAIRFGYAIMSPESSTSARLLHDNHPSYSPPDYRYL